MARVLVFVCALTSVLVSGTSYYCFEDKCRCEGNKADCRYNDEKLTFIPELPAHITSLDFSFNAVGEITTSDFFKNVTKVTSLQMTSTRLTYIVPGAFDDLKSLQRLDLSFNHLRRLPRNTFSLDTQRRLVQFNISHNKFVCDGDLVWIAEWMVSSPAVFADNVDHDYYCFDRHHHYQERDMQNFTCENYKVCNNRVSYHFVYVVLPLLIVIVIVMCVLACSVCRPRPLFSQQRDAKFTPLRDSDVESP